MPTKTNMLESGNFVYSPELPENPAFSEYLDFADRLLRQRQKVEEKCNCSPLSSELVKRKKELDEVLSDFVQSFKAQYTIKSVKQDPTFLPASQFFARYSPVREPFSVLYCSLGMPLHTVHRFQSNHDLATVNAALAEDTPFRWWQSGPLGEPCYLFGRCVWKLKPSEVKQSEEGITLLFLDISGRHQQTQEPLRQGSWPISQKTSTDFIPENVRILAWRQASGKCVKCGSHEGLEFDFVTAPAVGGKCTPANIELLCKRCYQRKAGPL